MFHSLACLPRSNRARTLHACAALVIVCLLAPTAPAAAATSISSTATFTPPTVNLGATVTINSSFTSSDVASNLNLDVEVRDAANVKVYQQLLFGQAFTAGQTRTFSSVWVTPASPAAAGLYTVKLGAFSSDWMTGYGWNDSAAVVGVGVVNLPPPRPSFTSTATASPSSVKPGASTNITATLTSATVANNINIDLEVRDAANKLALQRLFFNQSFAAGQSQRYAAAWSLPANLTPGTYTIKIGAFSSDWSTGYGWNDDAAPIDVQAAAAGNGITGTAYYVDCAGGNDGSAGTSDTQAWSSVSRASQAPLQPGDGLLFKRGCVWTGPLNAGWNGTSTQTITIGAYGVGALPKIQNANPYQIRVTGSYLNFDSLWVRSDPDFIDPGCNNNRIGYREGFYFDRGSAYNVVKNSMMSDLGGGLEIAVTSNHNSIHDNEFANNNMMYDTDQFRNDGGSAAMVVYGDNNDIGFNSIHDSNACSHRYVNNITGHAFDIETGNNNSFHHNRAWANGANFAEIVSAQNSTFAYNVVYNSFTNHTNSHGTRLFNNVFFMPGAGVLTCQTCSAASMTVKNNVFFSATGLYADGPLTESNNIFWNAGNFVYNTQALSSTSRIADPLFINAWGGDFHTANGSPLINAGSADSTNAGYTIDMDRKPITGGVDIGAFEH